MIPQPRTCATMLCGSQCYYALIADKITIRQPSFIIRSFATALEFHSIIVCRKVKRCSIRHRFTQLFFNAENISSSGSTMRLCFNGSSCDVNHTCAHQPNVLGVVDCNAGNFGIIGRESIFKRLRIVQERVDVKKATHSGLACSCVELKYSGFFHHVICHSDNIALAVILLGICHIGNFAKCFKHKFFGVHIGSISFCSADTIVYCSSCRAAD